jgi:hypothetical protein
MKNKPADFLDMKLRQYVCTLGMTTLVTHQVSELLHRLKESKGLVRGWQKSWQKPLDW